MSAGVASMPERGSSSVSTLRDLYTINEDEEVCVAGTMAANGSGLQMSTLRNIALAWVLTLPVAMMLSGFLYLVFGRIF
jgi:hypothetical protein